MFAQNTVTTETLCRQLVAYQPSHDVDFTPGKDVHGREVASADVDSGVPPIRIPDPVTIQITMDQAAQLGLPNTIGYSPEAYIGQVTVMKNGDVYFNNQRVSQPQIQALCDKNQPTQTDAPKRPVIPADLPN